jgi:hypothetical protein
MKYEMQGLICEVKSVKRKKKILYNITNYNVIKIKKIKKIKINKLN